MKLSVIVPYASDHGRRAEAWAWCRQRLERELDHIFGPYPDERWEIITGAPDIVGKPGLFNRPQAYNRAYAKCSGDVILLHDADTTFRPEWLLEAYNRVVNNRDWVMPTLYAKLSEEYSNHLLEQPPDVKVADDLTGKIDWVGQSWSGLVMFPREAFEAVNWGDERHLGWGWDDICLGLALTTLHREPVRVVGHALHLWHEAKNDSEDMFGQPHTHMQRKLMTRYEAASGDVAAMKALVNENGHGPNG